MYLCFLFGIYSIALFPLPLLSPPHCVFLVLRNSELNYAKERKVARRQGSIIKD